MLPVHTKYADAEILDFPGAITLKVLLSGSQTDGSQAIFEDIVAPGVGPSRHIHHGKTRPSCSLRDHSMWKLTVFFITWSRVTSDLCREKPCMHSRMSGRPRDA